MKKRNVTAREKRKEVLGKLHDLGLDLYGQFEEGNFPQIKMPSRSTDNIFYSPELKQYALGDKKVRRITSNIRHIKPFTQLVWIAYFADELTESKGS